MLPTLPPVVDRRPASTPVMPSSAHGGAPGPFPEWEDPDARHEAAGGGGARVLAVVALLVAGAIGLVLAGIRQVGTTDSSGDADVAAAPSLPVAGSDVAASPVTTAVMPAAPESALAPTTLPLQPPGTDPVTDVGALPAPATSLLVIPDMDAAIELRDRCRLEHGKVFASFQGFYLQTGAVPNGPDRLVELGWLEEHPEGWSARWSIEYREGAYYIDPVPGTLCAG